jgi:putative PIN family toxin of toxin-antitoxin system
VTVIIFDTGVLISAIGWRGPAHRSLALVAQRRCRLAVTADILAEYETRVPAVLATEAPQANARGALAWIRAKAMWVEPAPLGKRRARDPKDERFIAAALAAKAKVIVSYDHDLLALEKPFGISVMRPTAFLAWMENQIE